ncbi:unnamed protein product [Chrysoparadoxa australica]
MNELLELTKGVDCVKASHEWGHGGESSMNGGVGNGERDGEAASPNGDNMPEVPETEEREVWLPVEDPTYGLYYYNSKTGESKWSDPSQVPQDSDDLQEQVEPTPVLPAPSSTTQEAKLSQQPGSAAKSLEDTPILTGAAADILTLGKTSGKHRKRSRAKGDAADSPTRESWLPEATAEDDGTVGDLVASRIRQLHRTLPGRVTERASWLGDMQSNKNNLAASGLDGERLLFKPKAAVKKKGSRPQSARPAQSKASAGRHKLRALQH